MSSNSVKRLIIDFHKNRIIRRFLFVYHKPGQNSNFGTKKKPSVKSRVNLLNLDEKKAECKKPIKEYKIRTKRKPIVENACR